MGPEAYRRWRRRIAAISAGVLAGAVLLVPAVVVAIALYSGDSATLAGSGEGLLYFLTGTVVLGIIGAVISWFQTGGKRRTNAGAEPETQLKFAATTSGLAVTDGAGHRIEGPWPRWRIANVRSQVAHLKSGQLHILDSVELVMLADNGSSAGSVTLDPATLTKGRDFSATVNSALQMKVHKSGIPHETQVIEIRPLLPCRI
jgi:hypothetical protein